MIDFRLPSCLIRWAISFLYKRTAHIELENQSSRPFELKSGTLQGSLIFPLLYIIFTADSINSIPSGVDYDLFADDTTFLLQVIRHLEFVTVYKTLLRILKSGAHHGNLHFNLAKPN